MEFKVDLAASLVMDFNSLDEVVYPSMAVQAKVHKEVTMPDMQSSTALGCEVAMHSLESYSQAATGVCLHCSICLSMSLITLGVLCCGGGRLSRCACLCVDFGDHIYCPIMDTKRAAGPPHRLHPLCRSLVCPGFGWCGHGKTDQEALVCTLVY